MAKLKEQKPSLMFFYEIKEGDVLKQRAKSNKSSSGGGARDLRIRPADKFTAILAQMFPVKTSRDGVLEGTIHWKDDSDEVHQTTIKFWRPTDARPGEARIGRIHQIEGWTVADVKRYRAALGRGKKWFYLLVKDTAGVVWARLWEEESLPGEDVRVRRYVEERIRQTKPQHHVKGAFNFVTGEEYS